jgi:hypothetical protein
MSDPVLEQMQAEHAAKVHAHQLTNDAQWTRTNGMLAAFQDLPLARTMDPDTRQQASYAIHNADAEDWALVRQVANTEGPASVAFDPRRPEQFIAQLREMRELHLVPPGVALPKNSREVATLGDVAKAAEASMRRSGTMRAAAEILAAGEYDGSAGALSDEELIQLGRSADGVARLKSGEAVLVEKPADVTAEALGHLDRVLAIFGEDERKLAREAVRKAVKAGDLKPLSRIYAHMEFVTDPEGKPTPWCRLFEWSPGTQLPQAGLGMTLAKAWANAKSRAAVTNVWGADRAALHFANPFTGERGE